MDIAVTRQEGLENIGFDKQNIVLLIPEKYRMKKQI